jgi:hypothetical protein
MKPKRRRPNRIRPFFGVTIDPVIAAAVREEVRRTGRCISEVFEARLRKGFGIPEQAATP